MTLTDPADDWQRWQQEAGRVIGERTVAVKIVCPRGHGLFSLRLHGGDSLDVLLPAPESNGRRMIVPAPSTQTLPSGREFSDGTRWKLECPHPRCGTSVTVYGSSLVADCVNAVRDGHRRVRLE